MKRINNKIVGIYLLIFMYVTIYPILYSTCSASMYYNFLNPLFWFTISSLMVIFSSGEHLRYKNKIDKIQTITLSVMIYLILYFLSGLVFGYQYSPYSHKFIKIVINLWSYIPVIVFQEYTRAALANYTSRSKYLPLALTILFILVDLNYTQLGSNFNSISALFEYTSSTIIPIIVKNCLFTYLAMNAGCIPNIIYRGVIQTVFLLVPVFPNLDWFVTAVIEILTPSIIYFYMNFICLKTDKIVSRKIVNQNNPIRFFMVYVLLLIFVGFVLGLFKYAPVAIVSNSMSPVFNRGDVVILRKLKIKESNELKVNDILQYEMNGRNVIHRIVSIEEDINGDTVFITQGDNNNFPDSKPVTISQVRGVVKYVVPWVGYPSVWFNEAVSR